MIIMKRYMMRFALSLMIFVAAAVMPSQSMAMTAPDSIAICPPGEMPEVCEIPEEDVVVAPDEGAARLMSAEEIAVAVDSIRAGYDADWTELSMQGKLAFDGLPMRVTVKIYMKRGESVIMSARAPIFGEVARVEIDSDSIVFINKHNRTYLSQPFAGIAGVRPGMISDIQDILLGQVAVPGYGRMTSDLAALSQWISVPESGTLIYPDQPIRFPGTESGFVMDPDCWQLRTFVLLLVANRTLVEADYLYGDEGWTLDLTVAINERPQKGSLQLSYPDYAPSPLQPTEIGSRYRKVNWKELMKF